MHWITIDLLVRSSNGALIIINFVLLVDLYTKKSLIVLLVEVRNRRKEFGEDFEDHLKRENIVGDGRLSTENLKPTVNQCELLCIFCDFLQQLSPSSSMIRVEISEAVISGLVQVLLKVIRSFVHVVCSDRCV